MEEFIRISNSTDQNESSLYKERILLYEDISNKMKDNSDNQYLFIIKKLLECFKIYDKFEAKISNNVLTYLQSINTSANPIDKVLNLDVSKLIQLMKLYIPTDDDTIETYMKNKKKFYERLKLLEKQLNIENVFEQDDIYAIIKEKIKNDQGQKQTDPGLLKRKRSNEDIKLEEKERKKEKKENILLI